MNKEQKQSQRGVALFFAIFALFLLTGIAAALILEANTENSINSNYRNEQVAYFGAKAGVEEARARLMPSDPSPINPLPTTSPTGANDQIIYLVNDGAVSGSVQPWNSNNAYADDELCHDYYGITGMTAVAPDVRCDVTQLPGTSTWYTSYNSTLPFASTTAALPYKWVRIAPKVNGSLGYLTGSGSTATAKYYTINNDTTTPPTTGSTLICWDGQSERLLTTGLTLCSSMLTASNAPMTNVYLITALGVSSSGARKMVQTEAALNPVGPFPYGLFATSTACPAVNFTGNNPSTDSYTTAGGQTYAGSNTLTGGDVGSNGGVSVGNGNIGGIVGTLAPGVNCATPFSIGSNGTDVGPNCPGALCVPNSGTVISAPVTFPVPPAPNPAPPNTTYSGSLSIVPGTYGNISLTGHDTLTMAPGTYNINSISETGNGQITVSPAGTVVINISGTGQSNPINVAGNGITDDTNPNDFMINYGGTGSVSVAGNGNVTAILNAPLAALTQTGNGNWYGSILASTMTIGGNAFFHFDRASALSPPSNGYFTIIGYRTLPY